MRLYGIEPQTVTFPWGKMQVVSLGEEGRGRKLTYVPFQAEFDKDADDYEIGTSRRNLPKIIRTGKPSSGWIAGLSGSGTYTRGTHGTVYVLNEYVGNAFVVAYGYGAYGDAGRIGDWWEYLVTVREPAVFLVRPAGGAHKIKRYYLVFDNEKVVRVDANMVGVAEEVIGIALEDPDKLIHTGEGITELSNLIKKEGK